MFHSKYGLKHLESRNLIRFTICGTSMIACLIFRLSIRYCPSNLSSIVIYHRLIKCFQFFKFVSFAKAKHISFAILSSIHDLGSIMIIVIHIVVLNVFSKQCHCSRTKTEKVKVVQMYWSNESIPIPVSIVWAHTQEKIESININWHKNLCLRIFCLFEQRINRKCYRR